MSKVTKSFRGYDDFVVAYNAARANIAASLGANWHLVPAAYQWARVPAPWASCKVFGRTSKAPRDMRLPNARYWPDGTLPVGPEYAEPAPRNVATVAMFREMAERHYAAGDAALRNPVDWWGAGRCDEAEAMARAVAFANAQRLRGHELVRAAIVSEPAHV